MTSTNTSAAARIIANAPARLADNAKALDAHASALERRADAAKADRARARRAATMAAKAGRADAAAMRDAADAAARRYDKLLNDAIAARNAADVARKDADAAIAAADAAPAPAYDVDITPATNTPAAIAADVAAAAKDLANAAPALNADAAAAKASANANADAAAKAADVPAAIAAAVRAAADVATADASANIADAAAKAFARAWDLLELDTFGDAFTNGGNVGRYCIALYKGTPKDGQLVTVRTLKLTRTNIEPARAYGNDIAACSSYYTPATDADIAAGRYHAFKANGHIYNVKASASGIARPRRWTLNKFWREMMFPTFAQTIAGALDIAAGVVACDRGAGRWTVALVKRTEIAAAIVDKSQN